MMCLHDLIHNFSRCVLLYCIHMDNWAGYTDLSKLLALTYLDQEVTYITLITITRVFLCTIRNTVSIVLQIYQPKSCHFATMSGRYLE